MKPPITIESIRLRQVNLPPKVVRTDAIQSFVTQEIRRAWAFNGIGP